MLGGQAALRSEDLRELGLDTLIDKIHEEVTRQHPVDGVPFDAWYTNRSAFLSTFSQMARTFALSIRQRLQIRWSKSLPSRIVDALRTAGTSPEEWEDSPEGGLFGMSILGTAWLAHQTAQKTRDNPNDIAFQRFWSHLVPLLYSAAVVGFEHAHAKELAVSNEDCPFCKEDALTKEQGLNIELYKDEWAIVVPAYDAYSQGHVIVVLRRRGERHKHDLADLSASELALMAPAVEWACARLRRLKRGGEAVEKVYAGALCEGPIRGNSHMHFHLVPRYEKDPNGFTFLGTREAELGATCEFLEATGQLEIYHRTARLEYLRRVVEELRKPLNNKSY